MHSAFYEPAGTGAFAASPATAGPWSAQAQHGGPPSALAARAIELHEPDEGQRLARVAVDILRPVPVGKVTVRARAVRPGRRVALVEAIMEADGQEVLRARGWRLALAATAPTARSEGLRGVKGLEGLPGAAEIPPEAPLPGFFDGRTAGYLSAIDWRFVSGGNFDARERARVWARPRIPLLPGEEPSPMCRALLIADSGSGVSAVLDPARFLFINVDLTVVLQRDPEGEWLLLDAATTIGDHGTGLAETIVSDRRRTCGRALQTLLVAPR